MTKRRSYIWHDTSLVNWVQKTISVELAQAIQQVLDDFPIPIPPVDHDQSMEAEVNRQFQEVVRQFEVPLVIEFFSAGVNVRWWFVTYNPFGA